MASYNKCQVETRDITTKVCNFYIAIISYKGLLHSIDVRWKHLTPPLMVVCLTRAN